MMRFAKFLRKIELRLMTFRDGFQASSAVKDKFSDDFVEKSAVIMIHPNTARPFGYKDGQVVKVSANGRSLNLRLIVSEIAPENKALMPKSIYSSYLSDVVTIEPAEGEITKLEDIVKNFI